MESEAAAPESGFVKAIGPIIESLLDARAKLKDLDQSVANGVLTTTERRARSVGILKEKDRFEAELAFWLPTDAVNALRETISNLVPAASHGDRVWQVIDEVWTALDIVMTRNERTVLWKLEQARRYPPLST